MPSRLLVPRTKQIVECALAYEGATFEHQGRHPERMDCIGLIVLSHRDAGYEIEDWTTYSRQPDPATLFRYIEINFEQVDHDLTEGNVLLFNYRKRGPQHAAIFDGEGGLIHTWADVGHVTHNPNDERWLRRLHSVWHVKEERWQQ